MPSFKTRSLRTQLHFRLCLHLVHMTAQGPSKTASTLPALLLPLLLLLSAPQSPPLPYVLGAVIHIFHTMSAAAANDSTALNTSATAAAVPFTTSATVSASPAAVAVAAKNSGGGGGGGGGSTGASSSITEGADEVSKMRKAELTRSFPKARTSAARVINRRTLCLRGLAATTGTGTSADKKRRRDGDTEAALPLSDDAAAAALPFAISAATAPTPQTQRLQRLGGTPLHEHGSAAPVTDESTTPAAATTAYGCVEWPYIGALSGSFLREWSTGAAWILPDGGGTDAKDRAVQDRGGGLTAGGKYGRDGRGAISFTQRALLDEAIDGSTPLLASTTIRGSVASPPVGSTANIGNLGNGQRPINTAARGGRGASGGEVDDDRSDTGGGGGGNGGGDGSGYPLAEPLPTAVAPAAGATAGNGTRADDAAVLMDALSTPGESFRSRQAQLNCAQHRDPALISMSFSMLKPSLPAPGGRAQKTPNPNPISNSKQIPNRTSSNPSRSQTFSSSQGEELQLGDGGSSRPLAAVGMLMSASRDDRCTGALISKCHVLTAGHCIYGFEDSDNGGGDYGQAGGADWIRSWIFTPGWNGMNAPYGQFASRTAVVPPQLVHSNNPSYDIGLVVLMRNVPSEAGPFFELDEPPYADSDSARLSNGTSAVLSNCSTEVAGTGTSKLGKPGSNRNNETGIHRQSRGSSSGSVPSVPEAGNRHSQALGNASNYGSSSNSSSSSSGRPAAAAGDGGDGCSASASGGGGGEGGAGDGTSTEAMYQVRILDGVPVIVSSGVGGAGGASLNAARGGDHRDAGMGGEELCLNFAGYPTPLVRWAQYCRYLADLDNRNFVETTCKGRPGVSGAPLWVYLPTSANTTTDGGRRSNITGEGRSGSSGGGTHQAVRQGRRVMRGVLTAGFPGGPTGAVRIDPVLWKWLRQVQQKMPCGGVR